MQCILSFIRMVIEAYLFLKKHSTEAQKSQNSVLHDPNVPSNISISIQNRKRTIPPEAEEPKIKVMKSLQSENVLETGLQGIPIQIQKASPKKIAIAPTPLQVRILRYPSDSLIFYIIF